MKNFFLIIILFLFAACKKDILDSKPLTEFTDATVWQDSALVRLYLSGIYANVPSEFDNPTDLLAAITDEAGNNRPFAASRVITQAQFNAMNLPAGYNVWSQYYTNIRLCNVFLENINRVPQSAVTKSRMRGEVFFLRALYYHYLYNYFGTFPIFRNSLSLTDAKLFSPRASKDSCIAFISADCDSAAALLPVKFTGADIGRATKGAALALKCRNNLYAGNWQKASEAAEAVMALNTYGLFANYQGIFLPENEGNREVIFDKQYTADPTNNNTQSSYYDLYSGPPNLTGFASGVVNPTQNMVDLYEMADGTPFDWNNPVHARRPYFNRDPRLSASVLHDSSVWQGQIVDMKVGSVWSPNSRPSQTGYYLKKMMDPNYNYRSVAVRSMQNFILFRYAELLLNYAEAQWMLGNTEVARTYVNMVRARVNMPAISSANFTFDRYVNERRVELAFEGLRLWDINRWKQGPQFRGGAIHGVTITGTTARTYRKVAVENRVFADPKMYLFPIPQSEIDKYPNGGLVQNTGW